MLNGKSISVVVPAYNEETQILEVLSTMPSFVDRIIVVNDNSKDNTAKVVMSYIEKDRSKVKNGSKSVIAKGNKRYNHAEEIARKLTKGEKQKLTPSEIYNLDGKNGKVVLVNHLKNESVGAAIASGYSISRDLGYDCTAVMAGDGQMDPDELESICLPVINDGVDYVKGNRLIHRSAYLVIPKTRFIGNSILSLLTKVASGYWHVSDTQTGYTAISLDALKGLRLHEIYKTYGVPNDILVKLNISFATVKEVQIKPIYNVGEKSKMKIFKVIPKISWLLFKSFWKRLYIKYLFRDFHPLFLFYHFALLLFLIDLPFLYQVIYSFGPAVLPLQSLLIFMFLTISAFQAMFFAMWMDMLDNERLYIH